jgi:hypothetical protein
VSDNFFWSDEGDCVASKWAGLFAFITQFSLIGSELWFLVLTMVIVNPLLNLHLGNFFVGFALR